MSRHKYLFAVVIVALMSCFIASTAVAQTFSDMGAGLTAAKFATTVWGDYNSDGYLDLLVMGQNTSNVPTTRLYRSNAGASFTSVAAGFANVNASPNAAAWGDYDRDGDLDLVLSGFNGTTGVCNLYRNNGNGTFTDASAGLPAIYNSTVGWADIDKDGDLDLAIAGRTSTGVIARIYRNTDGSFADITAGLTGVEYASLAWADYDNDGDLDLLTAGSTGSAAFTRLYRNDSGTFVNSGISLPAVQSSSVAWGDYNNDGRLDLAISGYNGGTYYGRVYRNDGGSFTSVADLSRRLAWGCVAWGDYDNDGDLDLASSGLDSTLVAYTVVYRNDAGSFVDAGAGLPAAQASSIAWGDYDKDGRLDLAVAGMTGSTAFARIYHNTGGAANTAPNAPTGLAAAYNGGSIDLSWAAGSDTETPAAGLYYNVAVSTAAGALRTAPHSLASGFRLVPGKGNAEQRLNLHVGDLVDGVYYWLVQSIDSGWQGSAPSTPGTFTIDTIPPFNCSIVINGGDAYTNSKTVTLTLHSEDLLTTMEMRFSNDNSTWSAWEAYATSKSWDMTDADGTQTVYAQFRDLHNNVAPTVNDTIYLDKTLPTGTITVNSGDTFTNSQGVTLTLDATDPVGGGGGGIGTVTKMRFSNDNSTWSGWVDYATSQAWTLTAGDAEKTVYVQYQDGVGNVSSSFSDTITLDKTPPTGTVTINSGDAYTGTTAVMLTVSADDGTGSGVSQMSFSNTGSGGWSAWEAYATTKAWDLDPDADGTRTVYVRFKDVLGNSNPAPGVSDDIYLDKIAPAGTISINSGAATTASTTVDLTLSATDGASGVNRMRFSNDDASWSAWEDYATSKTGWVMASGDGTQTVYVQYEDHVGNISGSSSDTITLDQTGPTGTVVINGGNEYTRTVAVTLTLSATDVPSGVSQMRFSNDNATWSTWATYTASRAWIMDNIEGTRTVYAQFKDGLGNVSDSFTDTIVLDKTNPYLRSVSINGGAAYANSANVTLTLSATDALSGVSQMRFANENGIYTAWEPYGTTKSWTLSTGDGTKTVYAQFKDGAGNYQGTLDTIVLDTVRPLVTIGAPSATTTDVAPVSYTVTYSDANGFASIGFVAANVTLNKTGSANGTVSVTGTGDTRTVTIDNISGRGTLGISIASGTAVDVAGNTALAAGPTATFIVKAPPVNISISPASGTPTYDTQMVFTTIVSDPNGAANIRESQLLINDTPTAVSGAFVKYMPATNTLWLRNDTDTAWLGGRAPGYAVPGGTSIENGQCILDYEHTTVALSGNTLTIAWAITIKNSMSTKGLFGYLYTIDQESNGVGFTKLAAYYVNEKPSNVSIMPSAGTLTISDPPTYTTYTAVYEDMNGYQNISSTYFALSPTLAFAGGTSLRYVRGENKLYLRNDADNSWGTGVLLGTPLATLSNRQCLVDVQNTTVSGSGNQFTVNWRIALKPSQAGRNLNGWMNVLDNAGASSGTQKMGIYYTPVAPVLVSVSPNTITPSVPTDVPVTFTAVFSDANGPDSMNITTLRLNTSNTAIGSVDLYYNVQGNKIYLRNDSNTAWLGAVAPGTPGATFANSRCVVYGENTTVSMDPLTKTLTVSWRIALVSSTMGHKTLKEYMYASDLDGLTASYTQMGTITTP